MAAQKTSSRLEPWLDLSGKVVMVTGASSGLGREFCLDLAGAGCTIIAAARRVDRLNSLCAQMNRNGVRAVAVALDLCADGSSIEKSVVEAWTSFGRIDALVNNAGVRGSVKAAIEITEEEWEDVVRTNMRGTWIVSKYVCKRMKEMKEGGSIINITSAAGLNRGVFFGSAAYASSKAAMDILTKVMAIEIGGNRIRVNSIAPGLFKSEITESLFENVELNRVMKKMVPLQTFGTTNPVLTQLVRYLIHDSAQYVSGNVFIVEAGSTLPGVPIFSSL